MDRWICKIVVGSSLVAVAAYLASRYLDMEDTPIVRISSGDLVGKVSRSREGREFFQFLGIPYGKAERFESPQPADSWEGIRKAQEYGNMCMHVNSITGGIEGAEDCLHLNVFCPKFSKSPMENGKKLPVFVYVHGGYFMAGGSNYMGPMYLMQEDLVLVTINYRLASLGFLNSGDGLVRGNNGLKDQVLALRFVDKEISKFGGDPNNVILWGQSAGGAAVHFHLLSTMSRGLFRKAIMASGTAIKPWSLVTKPKEQAELLAKTVNCPTDNSTVMVQCLKKTDSKTLIGAHMDALDSPIMNPLKVFAPSIESGEPNDDTFLSEHPYDILKRGRAHRVPLLTGVNSHEGLLATARVYHNKTLAGIVETSWEELSPTFFAYQKSLTNVSKKIREFYFGESKNLNFYDMFLNFTNAFSDRWYIHSTRETVQTQKIYSPVYLYHFSYKFERGLTFFYDLKPSIPVTLQIGYKVVREWIDKHVFGREPLHLGTCHGDELVLFYHFPMVYVDVGDKDYVISRQFIKMWMQFANDEPITIENQEWNPLNSKSSELKYMHFGNDRSTFATQIDEPFSERMQFWDSLNLPWKIDV